jgi:hypothetical protein
MISSRNRAWRALAVALLFCCTAPGGARANETQSEPLVTPPALSAFPPIQRGAVLGYEQIAVVELLDEPHVLFQPHAQAFIDHAFRDLVTVVSPADRATFEMIREQLHDQPTFSAAPIREELKRIGADFLAPLAGEPSASSLALGSTVRQVAFNARMLHDRTADQYFRQVAGSEGLGVLDQLVPGLGESRRTLSREQGRSWEETASSADRIVAMLLAPPHTLAADTAVAVAASYVLLQDDGPRKGSGHFFLFIVRADGSRVTVGGYPDGTYAFNRSAKRLVCALEREPDKPPPRFIYYLTPAHGDTIAAVAARLRHACQTFNLHAPVAYDPLGENGKPNDNSLAFWLLKSVATPSDVAGVGANVAQSPAP